MKCREVQEYLNGLLVAGPRESLGPGLAEHLEDCPRCKREYEAARQILALLQPSHRFGTSTQLNEFGASTHLKEHIMSNIADIGVAGAGANVVQSQRINLWKPVMAAGVATLLVVLATVLHVYGPGRNPPEEMPAFTLLSKAWAAEEALFAGEGIVHIVNEIVVKPVSNAVLARLRWIPLVSLQATGRPRFHQLTLPAESGEQYAVDDQAWYDAATGRFVRLFSVDGAPIFANSYDGGAVYSLEIGPDGDLGVVETSISEDFQPPERPADFLGIAAGLPSRLDELDESLVSDVGEVKLDDGSQAHVLKSGFPDGGPEEMGDVYWLFTIREHDNTIAQMEWMAEGESLLVVRRVRTETVESPHVQWNLADIESLVPASVAPPKVGIRSDMVVQDVSVQNMIEKAGFEAYLFGSNPPWTSKREVTDILDIVSPPRRMFAVTYSAEDGRHVVLVQSHSYNTMVGPMTKMGKLVYSSPKGFKVWSGPRDKWLAGILLQSASAVIKDPPSEDRTGYVLETPAGTFPALAVNGRLTDGEFHALIDSLVPAREYAGE